ncbi:XRE family transcriptional regulator [Salmonella enterica subsp. arizonae]|jgi:transcriptional regulator with XRE-family HTH domain|uniref:helix-turn-helix domain-containing protein n=1 Tax=Raoultella planticola TaxID=575 RepID=UPI001387B566|nr:helix-turn-helix transcriptional regulator [Raoultella planticola]EAX4617964.1 helix-turn-helix transcriptional regulator [Salmonella enterica]ECF6854773.1 XRE family transcriptional regulator [Salmonella enterica subsp. arizonae]EDW1770995.1 helix-turn-helix transcriptional regulator [Salmonella enterica subsp. diarizonae]EDW1846423.1 helix-turn-helix transcriptional regulator [Salmonella enterica subsp. enterica]HCM1961600.1 helix-turn-helix transcriptional regulator [Salmonella enterica 
MTSVYSDDYQSVISALKQARVRQNITQTAIATALGRPQSFIAKVENGERRLDVVEFIRLAQLLGMDWQSELQNIARKYVPL